MIEVAVRLVPDEDEPDLCLPLIPVEFDGVAGEALLDSGAAHSAILERPGLRLQSSPDGSSVGAFGSSFSNVGRAKVMCRLGDVDLGGLEVEVVRSSHPGHGDSIGQDVLGRYRCAYNLADGTLVLDAPIPDQTHPIHVSARGHVYFRLAWANSPAVADAVFDTGASITIVDEEFAKRHPELFIRAGTSLGTDATGTQVETPMATMRGPQIFGQQLQDARIAIVDLSGPNSTLDQPMDIVLGWTITSQRNWFIDHSAARATSL